MADGSANDILVVPAAELDRLGRFQGFSPDAERYLDAFFRPEVASLQPRDAMESDPGFKQIISYVIFRCADQVFRYTRGKTQGEARLHAKISIGVGGHVDAADLDGRTSREAYEIALLRELDEEVVREAEGRLSIVGLINDDATPVGRVHLGIVHLFDLDAPLVRAREEGLADAGFVTIASLADVADRMESWSQIAIDHVLKV